MESLNSSPSKTPSVPDTITNRRTPSPLDIPEILGHIFSYLSNPTLRHSVALVSQQWFHLIQGRFPRIVVWDNLWTTSRQEAVLSRLVGAAHLHFFIAVERRRINGPPIANYKENIKKHLTGCQQEYHRQQQQKESTSRLYTLSPLKELHLEFNTFGILDTLEACLPDASINTNLTSLIFTFTHRHTISVSANLYNILQSCQCLETFEVQTRADGVELLWKRLPVDQDQQQQQSAVFPLRTLVLDHVYFRQASLENLLMFTPGLKVLQLIGMPGGVYASYDWPRLLRHLRSLTISLNRIHLSNQDQHLPYQPFQEMAKILEICPSSVRSEWNLWICDFKPTLLRDPGLRNIDRLTTLEIHRERTVSKCCKSEFGNVPLILHNFLSTSDKLVHLKTLKTIARLEDFDMHCRAGYFALDSLNNTDDTTCYAPPAIASSPHIPATTISHRPLLLYTQSRGPAVWRCCNLRVLHLEMHGPGQFQLKEPVHSRIIFGYIARVFPRLEELTIGTPGVCYSNASRDSYYPRLHVELESGLCLLSRLGDLRRLKFILNSDKLTSNWEEADLNWIAPSGRSHESREWRQMQIEKWQQQRVMEEKLETSRSQHRQVGSARVDVATEDVGVLDKLRDLGLLMDVEEVIKEMDGDSFQAMPSLEGVAFNRSVFLRPEKEIERFMSARR